MKNLFMQIYSGVMDADWNPLRKIPDLALRHLIMQVLAWMWCIIFSLYFGSFLVFGVTAAAFSVDIWNFYDSSHIHCSTQSCKI